ncbi:MAG TPA: hypothetical protein VK928_13600 [Longimicrobiales bacterium]|nr:hypothetical protein [Longimicrobiales bacterium]
MSGAKVLGLIVIVIAAAGVAQVARMMRPHDRLAEARDTLFALRASVDSCQVALDDGEAALVDWNRGVDSMRERVRAFEALDPRGVPQDSYTIYMRAFEAYNDSAASYAPRADTLQAQLERCRGLTRRHNLMADSVRRLLAARQRR